MEKSVKRTGLRPTDIRRLPTRVGLFEDAPDDRNHVLDCKIYNRFPCDLCPTSRTGIHRLLLSGSIVHCKQLQLKLIRDIWTNGVKRLRKITRQWFAVNVIRGICANMSGEYFVEPAFEASLAVRVSTVKENVRRVHQMRAYITREPVAQHGSINGQFRCLLCFQSGKFLPLQLDLLMTSNNFLRLCGKFSTLLFETFLRSDK